MHRGALSPGIEGDSLGLLASPFFNELHWVLKYFWSLTFQKVGNALCKIPISGFSHQPWGALAILGQGLIQQVAAPGQRLPLCRWTRPRPRFGYLQALGALESTYVGGDLTGCKAFGKSFLRQNVSVSVWRPTDGSIVGSLGGFQWTGLWSSCMMAAVTSQVTTGV